MDFTLTVKPKDKTAAGWMIKYFRWRDVNDTAPDIFIVNGWKKKNDAYEAQISCPKGKWGIVAYLALSGREIEVSLDPKQPITWPIGSSWPHTMKVPATQTQSVEFVYFEVA